MEAKQEHVTSPNMLIIARLDTIKEPTLNPKCNRYLKPKNAKLSFLDEIGDLV